MKSKFEVNIGIVFEIPSAEVFFKEKSDVEGLRHGLSIRSGDCVCSMDSQHD